MRLMTYKSIVRACQGSRVVPVDRGGRTVLHESAGWQMVGYLTMEDGRAVSAVLLNEIVEGEAVREALDRLVKSI